MLRSVSNVLLASAVWAVWAVSFPAATRAPRADARAISIARPTDSVTHAPGFDVSVAPMLMDVSGDSVTMSYIVTVAAGSHDSLTSFMVDAPHVLHVQAPGAWPGWWVSTSWHVRPTAGWGKDSAFLPPGATSPPLVYSARGLLDVVQYWAEVPELPGTVDTVLASESMPTSPVADTAVTLGGTTGFTVGVGLTPTDLSPAGLATRLSNLLTRACGMAWVNDQGVCSSLSVKVRPDSGSLGALLNELSAQRGKHITETGYILLSANAQFLLARI